MSSYRLSHISVENFKSIKCAEVDIFKKAFHILTGPNGSGKTNILEALSFGLGSAINHTGLRVNDANELSGWNKDGVRSEKQIRTLVQLTFTTSPSTTSTASEQGHYSAKKQKLKELVSQQQTLKIGCSYTGSVRHYLLNGLNTTKKKFQRVLAEVIGISKESGSWYITQHAVHEASSAKPKGLFNALCDAAGTILLRQERTQAMTQILKGRDVLIRVGSNISYLKRLVQRDIEIARQFEQYHYCVGLATETAAEMMDLAKIIVYGNIYACGIICLNQFQLIREGEVRHKLAKEKCVNSGSHNESTINELKSEIENKKYMLTNEEEKAELLRGRIFELQKSLDDNNSKMVNRKDQLSELEKAVAISKRQRAYIIDFEIPECLTRMVALEAAILLNPKNAASLAAESLEKVNVALISNLSEETDIGTQQMSIIASLAEIHQLLDRLESSLYTSTASTTTLRNSLNVSIDEFELLKSTISKQWLCPLGNILLLPDANKISDMKELLSSVAIRLNEIKKSTLLAKTKISRNNADLCLPYCPQLIEEAIDGDFGYFADILCLPPSAESWPYFFALVSLMTPVLAIRLCRDSVVASNLISRFMADRICIRIWPIQALLLGSKRNGENNKVTAEIIILRMKSIEKELLNKHDITAVSPLSILMWSESKIPGITIAVVKALGGWMIVQNDIIAMTVMSLKIKELHGCITYSGNKHIVGQLNPPSQTIRNFKLKAIVVRRTLLTEYDNMLQQFNIGISLLSKLQTLINRADDETNLLFKEETEMKKIQDNIRNIKYKVLDLEVERAGLIAMLAHCKTTQVRLHEELTFWNDKSNLSLTEHLADTLPIHNARKKTEVQQYLAKLENRVGNLNRDLQQFEDIEIYQCRMLIETLVSSIRRETSEMKGLLNILFRSEQLVTELADKLLSLISTLNDFEVDIIAHENDKDLIMILKRCQCELEMDKRFLNANAYLKRYFSTCNSPRKIEDLVRYMLPELIGFLSKMTSPETVRQIQSRYVVVAEPNDLLQDRTFLECSSLFDKLSISDFEAKMESCVICHDSDNATCIFHLAHKNYDTLNNKLQKHELEKKDALFKFWSCKQIVVDIKNEPSKKKNAAYNEANAFDLIQKHGNVDNINYISTQNLHLTSLAEKHAQIVAALIILESDIDTSGKLITQLHTKTYERIRARCKKYFSDLVPGKQIDLIPLSTILDDGLKFILVSSRNGQQHTARSIDELSGGQKSLLSLTYVFACALNRPSELYLMDEIDAALDEKNQQIVASIISKLFQDKTIFCVSHHPDFQMHAAVVLSARMILGHTEIVSS